MTTQAANVKHEEPAVSESKGEVSPDESVAERPRRHAPVNKEVRVLQPSKDGAHIAELVARTDPGDAEQVATLLEEIPVGFHGNLDNKKVATLVEHADAVMVATLRKLLAHHSGTVRANALAAIWQLRDRASGAQVAALIRGEGVFTNRDARYVYQHLQLWHIRQSDLGPKPSNSDWAMGSHILNEHVDTGALKRNTPSQLQQQEFVRWAKANMPAHTHLQFDDDDFIQTLAEITSMDLYERKRLVAFIPSLSQYQVDQFLLIFKEEVSKMAELDRKYEEQRKLLE